MTARPAWLAVLLVTMTLNIIAKPALAYCDPNKSASTPTQRFELRGDVAYDKRTHLTWARCSVGQQWDNSANTCRNSPKTFTWHDAQTQFPPGAKDWRMPMKDELESIVEHRCYQPSINEVVFPNTPAAWYWTGEFDSDPRGKPSNDFVVIFGGGPDYGVWSRNNYFAVRLIRSAP